MAFPSVKRSITAVLLVFFALAGLVLLPAPAAADYYDITAYIDALSFLIIKDNTMQWHNDSGWPVGKFPDVANAPTTIVTNGGTPDYWYPDWPNWNQPPDYQTTGKFMSSVYTGLNPSLPRVTQDVTLTKIEGRPEYIDISIVQNPSSANDYTLILAFNDGNWDAATWYRARVDFAPVPLPPSLLLLGSGLVGVALLCRKKTQEP